MATSESRNDTHGPQPPSAPLPAEMAACSLSIAVFVPEAGSRGRHSRDVSLKKLAQLGEDRMLLCRTVSTAVAGYYMGNVGLMPELSPSNDMGIPYSLL